jgi:hypothetical protein
VNILKLRKPGRAALTALVLGGVVAALAACDRDFTATVSSDQTVSGQLTFSADQDTWDASPDGQAPAQTFVEGEFAAAFPDSPISNGAKDGKVYDTVTFTGISFDEFETGLNTVLNVATGGDDATTSSLTFSDGVYRLDVPGISTSYPSSYGDPMLNELTLTFPTNVAESNGTVSGKTVTWDLLKDPDLTELRAVTAAVTTPVVAPTPTVKPTPTLSVAAGSLVKHGKARVGHRVSVTAPKALTAGTTVRYAWTVAGKKVGSAPSYKIGRKQAGKRLAVTVTYTKAGYKAVAKAVSFGRIKR